MLQLDKNLWTFYIKNFNAYMYVKQDENDYMRWNFYDSDHNFVDCFYGEIFELNEFVKLNVSEQFWDMFLVVIQLGAILAVVLLVLMNIKKLKKLHHLHGFVGFAPSVFG